MQACCFGVVLAVSEEERVVLKAGHVNESELTPRKEPPSSIPVAWRGREKNLALEGQPKCTGGYLGFAKKEETNTLTPHGIRHLRPHEGW